jgi:predicted DNA-binding transcriptional regulator AlpA
MLRRDEARRRAGISKSTERRLQQRDPSFPKVVRISPNTTGHFEDELTSG